MTLQQIVFFITIADYGNFSKAAEILYSSQPTLSRQIQMLEEELGYYVFQRDKRPLKLTSAGKILYDGFSVALSKINYTTRMANARALGEKGSLNIGFLKDLYAEYAFMPVINDIDETVKTLSITCCRQDVSKLEKRLLDGSLDMAVSIDFKQFYQESFNIYPIMKLKYFIVMSARHPLAFKKDLSLKDFFGENFFISAPILALVMKKIFGELLENFVQIEVSSQDDAYMNVLVKNGFTIANEFEPVIKNKQDFYCYAIEYYEEDVLLSTICKVGNENAGNKLFLELIKNHDIR
ncbi:LysR substrate binding domain-containing protein [Acetitomaculum ruminis DSM 5522]|uniref:LysR substrate binding domain-containing protein n=1 Tax=Acetitomaculum ruminis DSM 5522 TaxID=1120918 RepID=A0A1I0WQ23_9FIRM|nr:LysR family transcriptional regulator [Acetitomaculum ruminis]SFA90288.1 LysR substrate binding domain-containing protein [Acetitomaculum ruminis DSM 5522]